MREGPQSPSGVVAVRRRAARRGPGRVRLRPQEAAGRRPAGRPCRLRRRRCDRVRAPHRRADRRTGHHARRAQSGTRRVPARPSGRGPPGAPPPVRSRRPHRPRRLHHPQARRLRRVPPPAGAAVPPRRPARAGRLDPDRAPRVGPEFRGVARRGRHPAGPVAGRAEVHHRRRIARPDDGRHRAVHPRVRAERGDRRAAAAVGVPAHRPAVPGNAVRERVRPRRPHVRLAVAVRRGQARGRAQAHAPARHHHRQGARAGHRPPRPEAEQRALAPDRGRQVHHVGDRLRVGADRERAGTGAGQDRPPGRAAAARRPRRRHRPVRVPAAGEEGAARADRRRPRARHDLVPTAEARPDRRGPVRHRVDRRAEAGRVHRDAGAGAPGVPQHAGGQAPQERDGPRGATGGRDRGPARPRRAGRAGRLQADLAQELEHDPHPGHHRPRPRLRRGRRRRRAAAALLTAAGGGPLTAGGRAARPPAAARSGWSRTPSA
ncbi:hypothetical protein FTUN_2820 [Frigoriglobus tundricola]|uniref:Uncharacterized protein n=1 Tax=Frigoriglobus tundricola TaxID=2774151 RepID=A0A6M5YMW6_9BACT|nr:hypothetical protein FTUN_2820 [Frigoriglobus tundricola]